MYSKQSCIYWILGQDLGRILCEPVDITWMAKGQLADEMSRHVLI
jgi:hypothetical protein